MIVDAHQHFWRYEPAGVRLDRRPDGGAQARFHAGGPRAAPGAGGRRRDDRRADAADASKKPNGCCSWPSAHPFIAGVVGWVDLRADDVAARVERLCGQPRLAGIRHVVQSEPDDRFLLDAAFGRGIAALGQAGLPYDILIYPRHLPVAAEFVGALSVADLRARSPGEAGDPAAARSTNGRATCAGLPRAPNVWCKLSGLVTEADWRAWTPEQIEPYLDVAFECFGAGAADRRLRLAGLHAGGRLLAYDGGCARLSWTHSPRRSATRCSAATRRTVYLQGT